MTSWLKRNQAGTEPAPITATHGSTSFANHAPRFRDPNAPDVRLDIESKCIYERRLPGEAYISAHVTRLQEGFYDSPSTHGDLIDNVRFLAVCLVFHPAESINRFQSATVTVSLHDDTNSAFTDPPRDSAHRLAAFRSPVPRLKPRFLKFAPHIMFGAVSPETLDWNFNLTGSLGVSQTPVTASLAPTGGVKGSYKVYQMMRIQGSTRTLKGRHSNGTGYDVEDGEVVWTIEENPLQKSGLPREMTFVMLLTKGDVENVVIDINIEPTIASWFGHYPKWWCGILKYQPLQKEHMDLDKQLGQCFNPAIPGKGFNFANLASTFNDFVSLPGTRYSTIDQGFANEALTSNGEDLRHQHQQHQQQYYHHHPHRQKQLKPVLNGIDSTQYLEPNRAPPPQYPLPAPLTRSRSVSAQQHIPPAHDEPMDYHIYLHNPRTINLHATPPPQPNFSPSEPSPATHANVLHATSPVQRARSTAPERTQSPANIKMKRRSIDITYMGNVVSPSPPPPPLPSRSHNRSRSYSHSHSQSQPQPSSHLSLQHEKDPPVRKISGSTRSTSGSLRRSHSRTDLRSSPLVKSSESSPSSSFQTNTQSDSHSSDCSQISDTPRRSSTNQAKAKPSITLSASSSPEPIPAPIPMEAPSPPGGSSKMMGPPLPSLNFPSSPFTKSPSGSGKAGPGTSPRLPFELRRNHSDKDHQRRPRSRDSPSPMRVQRETTPSPGEELVNMNIGNHLPPPFISLPPSAATAAARHLAAPLATNSERQAGTERRRERNLRDLSPYAYVNGATTLVDDEDWDESKGDLKKMRQRKKMTLPHYSYIAHEEIDGAGAGAGANADADADAEVQRDGDGAAGDEKREHIKAVGDLTADRDWDDR